MDTLNKRLVKKNIIKLYSYNFFQYLKQEFLLGLLKKTLFLQNPVNPRVNMGTVGYPLTTISSYFVVQIPHNVVKFERANH